MNYRVTPSARQKVTPLKDVVYGGGQQQATVSVELINLEG